MKTCLAVSAVTSLLSVACLAQQAAPSSPKPGTITSHSEGLHGYIGFSTSEPPDRAMYSAGVGFYTAVWPLVDQIGRAHV